MTEIKPVENRASDTKLSKELMKAIGVARSSVNPGRELNVEMGPKGLALVKSGMKYGVTNGTRMILDIQFESIVVCENGWMVASKHGIYYVYDEEGNIYKGLSFLKKENAIRFAKTL